VADLVFSAIGLVWLLCGWTDPVPRVGRLLAFFLQLIAAIGLLYAPFSPPLLCLHTIGLLGMAGLFPFCLCEHTPSMSPGRLALRAWFSLSFAALWLQILPAHDLKIFFTMVAMTTVHAGLLVHREVYLWRAVEALLLQALALLLVLGRLLPNPSPVPPLLATLATVALALLMAGRDAKLTGRDLRSWPAGRAFPLAVALLLLGTMPSAVLILALLPLLHHFPSLAVGFFAVFCTIATATFRWAIEPWRGRDGDERAVGTSSSCLPLIFLGIICPIWLFYFAKFFPRWT
jgi:hypothetical protein